MPLISIKNVGQGSQLGIWQMTERSSDLPRPKGIDLSDVHTDIRLREKLTEYCLLKSMTGRNDIFIGHEPSDRPFIDGYHISISHTHGWAAMMLSQDRRVGVDIEYFSDRVNRVAERFIRKDEQNDDLEHRLINWSVKETVYKLFSEEDLGYFEMRLHQFDVLPRGTVTVDDLKTNKSIEVDYVLNKNFALTYADFMFYSKK